MTGFAVPGVNVVVPGVVVPGVVVPRDDGPFFFLSPAVPSPVVLGPAVPPCAPGPVAPGPVVAAPAGPGLPPGCCEKPGNACEGVPSLEGVPALAGVPGVPGVPAALAGVAGRMSTTGLPGFAAMTPGPLSWAGCAVAATARMALILRQRKRRILGRCLHVARLLLRRRNVALLGERKLLRCRLRRRPARAAVEAGFGRVIHHDGLAVDVGDRHAADVVHGPVVEEGAVAPVAALVTDPAIAESVVRRRRRTRFPGPNTHR